MNSEDSEFPFTIFVTLQERGQTESLPDFFVSFVHKKREIDETSVDKGWGKRSTTDVVVETYSCYCENYIFYIKRKESNCLWKGLSFKVSSLFTLS